MLKKPKGSEKSDREEAKPLSEYLIVYRKFKRGRRSLKTAYTLATCIRDAKMAAQSGLAEEAPMGTVMFVRKVG